MILHLIEAFSSVVERKSDFFTCIFINEDLFLQGEGRVSMSGLFFLFVFLWYMFYLRQKSCVSCIMMKSQLKREALLLVAGMSEAGV